MNQHAYEIIKEGCSLMKSYWLASGTMLGLYREGDLIEWDTDIDVETTEIVDLQRFHDAGFKLLRKMESDRIYQHAFIKKDVIFDVYYFYKEGKELINYNDFGVAVQPYKLFFPRGEFEWKGQKWQVPNDVEEYLELRYKNWRTPTKAKSWGSLANHLR